MMTTMSAANQIEKDTSRNESTASFARVTLNPFSNLGVPFQELERTFGSPRSAGDGARRAVHQFGEALEKLSE